MGADTSPFDSIRFIPLSYNQKDSHNSALNLILTLRPEWRETKATIEFIRFTDGITNTVRLLATRVPLAWDVSSPANPAVTSFSRRLTNYRVSRRQT